MKEFTRKEFVKEAGLGVLFPFLAGTGASHYARGGLIERGGSRVKKEVPDEDRILISGGTVLTMDHSSSGFKRTDVLIENGEITEIAPDIKTDAYVINADGRIVMPGFVDTHRHMWQGALRNRLPDGTLEEYMEVIGGQGRSVYRPEDVEIGNLVSALGALDAGVTTVLDWSHINNTPVHTDAAVRALRAAGIRAVYGYGTGQENPDRRFPEDIHRVREELVPDDTGLLTLALAAGINVSQWELAREVGARISVHVNGTGDLLPMAELMGPDVTCIHCCRLLDEEWELLADTGAGVSISAPVEMIMGHGVPPIREALTHDVLPSLSVDVETTVPGDMFTQMQAVFALQRMQVHRDVDSSRRREQLISPEQVVRFATLNGAIHNGLDSLVGSLRVGKRADLIMLDTTDLPTAPLNDPFGAVVNGMGRNNVEMVMVDGTIRKWNGELVIDDPLSLIQRLADSREHIWRQAGW